MITLNTFSLRYRNIWMKLSVSFWMTSPGHRTCLRIAAKAVKMKRNNKTGANLLLSYRFAPVLCRYALSIVYLITLFLTNILVIYILQLFLMSPLCLNLERSRNISKYRYVSTSLQFDFYAF